MGSMLATMSRVMPYAVPGDYFTGLSAAAREQITYETDPVIHLPKQTPFTAPEDYFASFPGEMLRTVQAEYNSMLPQAEMPLEAPEGYFEQLPGRILAAVKQEAEDTPAPAKVIPLKRILSWKPLRYAVAAMLITGAGLGLYQLTMTDTEPVMKQLSKIPKEDVRSYILYHIDEFETEDLFLAVRLASIDKKSFTTTPGLSDENIIQYLDETGWDTELY